MHMCQRDSIVILSTFSYRRRTCAAHSFHRKNRIDPCRFLNNLYGDTRIIGFFRVSRVVKKREKRMGKKKKRFCSGPVFVKARFLNFTRIKHSRIVLSTLKRIFVGEMNEKKR